MEEAIKRLEKRHKEHIILYDPTGVSEREKEGGGKKGVRIMSCHFMTGVYCMSAPKQIHVQNHLSSSCKDHEATCTLLL